MLANFRWEDQDQTMINASYDQSCHCCFLPGRRRIDQVSLGRCGSFSLGPDVHRTQREAVRGNKGKTHVIFGILDCLQTGGVPNTVSD